MVFQSAPDTLGSNFGPYVTPDLFRNEFKNIRLQGGTNKVYFSYSQLSVPKGKDILTKEQFSLKIRKDGLIIGNSKSASDVLGYPYLRGVSIYSLVPQGNFSDIEYILKSEGREVGHFPSFTVLTPNLGDKRCIFVGINWKVVRNPFNNSVEFVNFFCSKISDSYYGSQMMNLVQPLRDEVPGGWFQMDQLPSSSSHFTPQKQEFPQAQDCSSARSLALRHDNIFTKSEPNIHFMKKRQSISEDMTFKRRLVQSDAPTNSRMRSLTYSEPHQNSYQVQPRKRAASTSNVRDKVVQPRKVPEVEEAEESPPEFKQTTRRRSLSCPFSMSMGSLQEGGSVEDTPPEQTFQSGSQFNPNKAEPPFSFTDSAGVRDFFQYQDMSLSGFNMDYGHCFTPQVLPTNYGMTQASLPSNPFLNDPMYQQMPFQRQNPFSSSMPNIRDISEDVTTPGSSYDVTAGNPLKGFTSSIGDLPALLETTNVFGLPVPNIESMNNFSFQGDSPLMKFKNEVTDSPSSPGVSSGQLLQENGEFLFMDNNMLYEPYCGDDSQLVSRNSYMGKFE